MSKYRSFNRLFKITCDYLKKLKIMKYLKSYNESIRHFLKPKSREQIEKGLEGLDYFERIQVILKRQLYPTKEIQKIIDSLSDDDVIKLIKNYSVKDYLRNYVPENRLKRIYSTITEIYNLIKNSPIWHIKNLRDYQALEYGKLSYILPIRYELGGSQFTIMFFNGYKKINISIRQSTYSSHNVFDNNIYYSYGIFDKKSEQQEFTDVDDFFNKLTESKYFPEPLKKYFTIESFNKNKEKIYYKDKSKLPFRDRKRLSSKDIIDENIKTPHQYLDNPININEFLTKIGYDKNRKVNIIEWWNKNRKDMKIYYFHFNTIENIAAVCIGVNEVAINESLGTRIPDKILLFLLLHESKHSDQHKNNTFDKKYFQTVLNEDKDNFLKYYKELEKEANDYAFSVMEELNFDFSIYEKRWLRQNEDAGEMVYKMMINDIKITKPNSFIELIRKQIVG